jgi:hypothetical protein
MILFICIVAVVALLHVLYLLLVAVAFPRNFCNEMYRPACPWEADSVPGC